MVVAVIVEIVSAVIELFHFKFVFFGETDLVVDHTGTLEKDMMVEAHIAHVNFHRVPQKIVNFINIKPISRV